MTGVFWAIIAIILDYIFIVKLFSAVNYYKTDVFVYYIIIFLIPLIIGLYIQGNLMFFKDFN